MSREALALDISRVVSRVVSGEPIDTAERGAALAAKYPDLGMNGEMIDQAIVRAASMVGMIRTAPPPVRMPRAVEAVVVEAAPVGDGAAQSGDTRQADQPPIMTAPAPIAAPEASAAAPVARIIDDELAAAIDAEIGNLISGRAAEPIASARTNGEEHPPEDASLSDIEDASPPPHETAEETPRESPRRGPVAALRRVFFRN